MAAEGIENREIAAALAHFATDRATVEAAIPGVARGRAGKGRSASRPEPIVESRSEVHIDKLVDIAGLYLNPPDRALVFCVDEKSQILGSYPAGLSIKPGRCGTMTHEYKRHGTTTLFVALSMLD